MYQLISQNLTQLGGPMGTERVTTNFRKFFTSAAKAKAYAEKDYSQHKNKKIKWVKMGKKYSDNGTISSGDLLFVEYLIKPVEVVE